MIKAKSILEYSTFKSNFLANFLEQILHEIKIMDCSQNRAKHFFGFKKMADIGASIISAGVATALFINWVFVFEIASGFYI